jgi:hypothetical protein
MSKPAAAAALAELAAWLSAESAFPAEAAEPEIEFRPLRLLLVDRLETRFRFNISLSLIGAEKGEEFEDIWKEFLETCNFFFNFRD